MFRNLREPVNGLTHLAAAAVALIGTAVLVWAGRDSTAKAASLLLYGLTLVLMFSASAAYHLVNLSGRVTAFLRKLDHSAIYLLIAGTYTPICLHFFTGFWRWPLLAIVWAMALTGIAVKLFVINAPRWATAGAYLVMGWLSLIAAGEIVRTLPPGALAWLVVGGLFFTVGAVVYILKRPNFFPGVFGFHEVWHIFVILGAFSHYVLILVYVALPAP
jgi:hemolysin III